MSGDFRIGCTRAASPVTMNLIQPAVNGASKMAGPFPGIDPYVECQGNWPDFHSRLIVEASNALGIQLPDEYVPRVDERIEVVGFNALDEASYRPDILIAREQSAVKTGRPLTRVSHKIKPVLIDISDEDLEELRHTWLEIHRLPGMELVTVIEVLSPTNKSGIGRAEYLEKRKEFHSRKINLVEIDLLLGGHRVPMKKPLRRGHYFTIIARGANLPTAEVYSWTLRDPVPSIPIPLRPPDTDVFLDLQELVTRVYDLGRYSRTLHHDQPLPQTLALHPKDRAWAEAIGQAS